MASSLGFRADSPRARIGAMTTLAVTGATGHVGGAVARHLATEQAIRDSGVDFTFLRDSFYADVFPLFVDAEGAIRGQVGDGRVSLVTRGDVAEVAATVLRDPPSPPVRSPT